MLVLSVFENVLFILRYFVSLYICLSICLSVLSKVLEKIVCTQITKFMEDNNLLPQNQHGFREGSSFIKNKKKD